MIKILIWFISSKHTRDRLAEYFVGIEEIQIFEEIQTSYSHTKARHILGCQNLRKLFHFFVAEDGDNFLSNFSGTKYDRYKQALDDLMSWHEEQDITSD